MRVQHCNVKYQTKSNQTVHLSSILPLSKIIDLTFYYWELALNTWRFDLLLQDTSLRLIKARLHTSETSKPKRENRKSRKSVLCLFLFSIVSDSKSTARVSSGSWTESPSDLTESKDKRTLSQELCANESVTHRNNVLAYKQMAAVLVQRCSRLLIVRNPVFIFYSDHCLMSSERRKWWLQQYINNGEKKTHYICSYINTAAVWLTIKIHWKKRQWYHRRKGLDFVPVIPMLSGVTVQFPLTTFYL